MQWMLGNDQAGWLNFHCFPRRLPERPEGLLRSDVDVAMRPRTKV